MADQNSRIILPNRPPPIGPRPTVRVSLGGWDGVEIFEKPGEALIPASFEVAQPMIGTNMALIHACIREIVALRERVNALEAENRDSQREELGSPSA